MFSMLRIIILEKGMASSLKVMIMNDEEIMSAVLIEGSITLS